MKTFKEMAEAAVEDHYVIPPSGLSRCLKCPGSVHKSIQLRANGVIGVNPPSEYANEGTLMHDLADQWIQYHAGVTDEKPEQEPCEDLAKYIDECVSKLCPECDEHFEHSVKLFYDNPMIGDKYWIVDGEKLFKVKPSFLPSHRYEEHTHTKETIGEYVRATGTLDFAAYHPDTKTLYIRDLKWGMMPVKSKFNLQQAAYVMSLIEEYILDVEEVNIAIVQPRLEGEIEEWILTFQELEMFCEKQFDEYLPDIVNGNSTHFSPSEDACRFCECAHHCVAFCKPAADVLVKLEGKEYTEDLPEETMAELFRDSSKIKKVLTKIEEYVKAQADSFDGLPAWAKMTMYRARKGNKRWVDEVEAAVELESRGIHATTTKLMTPTQVAKNNPGVDLEALITQDDAKPRIVHIDEPGDPV